MGEHYIGDAALPQPVHDVLKVLYRAYTLTKKPKLSYAEALAKKPVNLNLRSEEEWPTLEAAARIKPAEDPEPKKPLNRDPRLEEQWIALDVALVNARANGSEEYREAEKNFYLAAYNFSYGKNEPLPEHLNELIREKRRKHRQYQRYGDPLSKKEYYLLVKTVKHEVRNWYWNKEFLNQYAEQIFDISMWQRTGRSGLFINYGLSGEIAFNFSLNEYIDSSKRRIEQAMACLEQTRQEHQKFSKLR